MKLLMILCCVALAGCNLFESVDGASALPPLDMLADTGGDLDGDISDARPDIMEQNPDAATDSGFDTGPPVRLPLAVAAYDFDTAGATIVEDRTDGTPYDLQPVGDVQFRDDATVFLGPDALLQTTTAPAEFTESAGASGEFAVAIWLATSDVVQGTDPEDPATNVRIVSYSINTAERNFTLAQWFDRAVLRVRTENSNENGLPQTILDGIFADTRVHLYLFQIRNGVMELYVDGILVHSEAANGKIEGWDSSYPLVIGNEASGNRGWSGRIYSLALYDRGFDSRQISDAFRAGPDGLVPGSL